MACSPPLPEAARWPAISGSPQAGGTLTADNGTWVTAGDHASYTNSIIGYQWESSSGGAYASIGGATNNTYVVQSGDSGKTLRCTVTASNAGGVTSQASAPVAISPAFQVHTDTTVDQFITALANESYSLIQFDAGTYTWPYQVINVDRASPITVQPTTPGSVTFSGANVGSNPQFTFGLNGASGNMQWEHFNFDGYRLGSQGVIQVIDSHDMTLDHITMTNLQNNGIAPPYRAWGLYIAVNGTAAPVNLTASNWDVTAISRQTSALTVGGETATTQHVHLTNWTVRHCYYAAYCSMNVTDLILDGWTIIDTGGDMWGGTNVAVGFEVVAGQYSNMVSDSGGLDNNAPLTMLDGGGNVFPFEY